MWELLIKLRKGEIIIWYKFVLLLHRLFSELVEQILTHNF